VELARQDGAVAVAGVASALELGIGGQSGRPRARSRQYSSVRFVGSAQANPLAVEQGTDVPVGRERPSGCLSDTIRCSTARARSTREAMPSLRKVLRRWVSTVLRLRKSSAAISGLGFRSTTSRATSQLVARDQLVVAHTVLTRPRTAHRSQHGQQMMEPLWSPAVTGPAAPARSRPAPSSACRTDAQGTAS
jgi:hypothetical protein